MSLHKRIGTVVLRGASLVVPIVVALWILIWMAAGAEGVASKLLTSLLPEELYVPGMGIALFLGLIFLVGLLMYPWVTRKLVGSLDRFLRNIPLFGSVYSPVKDLMGLFGGDMGRKLGQPVMITVPNTDMETLGFITRDNGKDLPEGFLPEGHVVVFVQWSSQVGGYCFIVPRNSVRSVDMSVEEGLRWSLTAGLSAPRTSGGTEGSWE